LEFLFEVLHEGIVHEFSRLRFFPLFAEVFEVSYGDESFCGIWKDMIGSRRLGGCANRKTEQCCDEQQKKAKSGHGIFLD
jgi:hypothetical protein